MNVSRLAPKIVTLQSKHKIFLDFKRTVYHAKPILRQFYPLLVNFNMCSIRCQENVEVIYSLFYFTPFGKDCTIYQLTFSISVAWNLYHSCSHSKSYLTKGENQSDDMPYKGEDSVHIWTWLSTPNPFGKVRRTVHYRPVMSGWVTEQTWSKFQPVYWLYTAEMNGYRL